MSQPLISRNPDLQRLSDDGYHIEIRANRLVVNDVPYVTSNREVRWGTLVSDLTLSGEVTQPPETHVIYFSGDFPCNQMGNPIEGLRHASAQQDFGEGLIVQHSFSSKPATGYSSYYDKVTTYFAILSGPALAIDPSALERSVGVSGEDEQNDSFQYTDTASGRAGLGAANRVFYKKKIGIIGLGGTGAYVLDLVAKTPVASILLFDGDFFLQHNAFRAPGAPSRDELSGKPKKVAYLEGIYAKMHKGIRGVDSNVGEDNANLLADLDFAFVCVDNGAARRLVTTKLCEYGIPFVDTGMGIQADIDGKLGGIVRITTDTERRQSPVPLEKRMPLHDTVVDEAYEQNIQIADLNAFNASLAVIRWKKMLGFYRDTEHEHHTTYTIDGNTLINEDKS